IRCGTRPWTSLRARRACPGSRQATRRPRRAASRWFRPPWQTLIANGNDEMRAVLGQRGVTRRRRGETLRRNRVLQSSGGARGAGGPPRPARARRHARARGSRMEQVCERVGALALLWLATAAAAAPLVWLARRAPPAAGALDAVVVGGGVAAGPGLGDAAPARPRPGRKA